MSTNFQPAGSLFGQSFQQPQQTSGLFGNLGQTQPGQQASGLFGGFAQPSQNQQQGVSFGISTLGQNNQLQQSRNLPLGFGTQQQQLPNVSIFGQSQAQSLPPLGQGGIWQPNGSINSHEKSVPEQMAAVFEKWDSSNHNCAFKYYFYNKVDDNMAPYYRPGPNDDPKAWDEALSNKPDKGYIPVLCVGFAQMGERIKLQQRNLANFNARLHEINNSLSRMMQDHETRTSIKAMDARRKHTILKQRCIALATKVQVLRNRGYALGGDEEDLKIKLLALERQINDPALGARGEEIWARMLAVQDRANLLKSEIGKAGQANSTMIGEELTRRAKKILEDYYTQLNHLSSEMESIKKDYEEWVKEKGHPNASNKDSSRNN